MNVHLRERIKGKKIHLYLDYYDKGKRSIKYLRLFLYPQPKDQIEKKHNRDIRELAKKILSKEYLAVNSASHDMPLKEQVDKPFDLYFEHIIEKLSVSVGNHSVWNSAYKHFKIFAGSNIMFSHISKKLIDNFKDYLLNKAIKPNGEPLKQNTMASYFVKFKVVINHAIADGLLKEDPGKFIPLIKEEDTHREFLTVEELSRIILAPCENEIYKKAFLFGCLTGLRFSDIKELKWRNIQYTSSTGNFIRFQQQKTNGMETMPITEDAYHLCGEKKDPHFTVFEGLEYSDLNNDKLRKWMKDSEITKHITFHCSRHTFAVLQLISGTDIYTLSKLLGHKSIKTTEVYAKIVNEKKLEAVNRFQFDLKNKLVF